MARGRSPYQLVMAHVDDQLGGVISTTYLFAFVVTVKFAKYRCWRALPVVSSANRGRYVWPETISTANLVVFATVGGMSATNADTPAKGDVVNQVGTSVGPRPKRGSTPAESVGSTRLRRPPKLMMRTLITGSGGLTGAPMPDGLLSGCRGQVAVADLDTGVGGWTRV